MPSQVFKCPGSTHARTHWYTRTQSPLEIVYVRRLMFCMIE